MRRKGKIVRATSGKHREQNIQTEDTETRRIDQAWLLESVENKSRTSWGRGGKGIRQADFRKATRTNHVQPEGGENGNLVRITSGTNQEQITDTLRMRRQGKLVRRTSGKHQEQITYILGTRDQLDFREASRTNHLQTDNAEQKKMSSLTSRRDWEQITYILRMRRQRKMVSLTSGN